MSCSCNLYVTSTFIKNACYSPVEDSDYTLVILRELLEQVGGKMEKGNSEFIQVGTLEFRPHIPNGCILVIFHFKDKSKRLNGGRYKQFFFFFFYSIYFIL